MDIQVLASGSKGNCYYISDGITPLLLEAGISYRDVRIGLNFQTSQIAGCLITHEHGDHAKSVKDLMKAGIDCYLSQGTADAIKATSHRANIVSSKQQFQLGSWAILPFQVEHDAAEPLGFLLANQNGEKLLYVTDTYYLRYKFNGLTHIMLETNYSIDILNENVDSGRLPFAMKKRLLTSHFSLENAKEFLKANDLSKVQEIWLLHLSDNNSDAARFKREIQELTGKQVYIAERPA